MSGYKYKLLVGTSEDGNPLVATPGTKLVEELAPLESGKPITGPVVQAEHIGPVFRIKEHNVAGDALGRSGPVQVANKEYREGWDNVFGKEGLN